MTKVNVIEMVKAEGLVEAGAIRLFLMENRKATIASIQEALVELGVALPKGRHKKIVYADLLARAIEMADLLDEDNLCKECEEAEAVDYGLCDACYDKVNKEAGVTPSPAVDTRTPVQASAAGESPVAEENINENNIAMEESEMEEKIIKEFSLVGVLNNGGLTEEQLQANLRMLDKSKVTQGSSIDYNKENGVHINPSLIEMLEKVETAKDDYLRRIGEYAITVESIIFYPTEEEMEEAGWTRSEIRRAVRNNQVAHEDQYGRKFIGEVTVRIPEDYMLVKIFNRKKVNSKGRLGAPDWIPFHGVDENGEFHAYDLNAVGGYNMFQNRKLVPGEGLLTLPIREGEDGKPFVRLPVAFNDYTNGYDGLFRTADIRYAKSKDATRKDEPLFLEDNNNSFNAKLSAFIQLFTEEFVQFNPQNNYSINKASCVNMIRFQMKDGVSDDLETSVKSRVILEQPDITQLAQVGSHQPQAYCPVRDIWLDMEAVDKLNAAERLDGQPEGVDADGNVRYPRFDEVVIDGYILKRREVREEAIKKICGACPFNCMNAPKREEKVSQEKAELREKLGLTGADDVYVDRYYKEYPTASKQAIQTLVEEGGVEKWVVASPGEVENPLNVRVKGADIAIYGSDDVLGLINPDFVAPMEAVDERLQDVMNKIDFIFYAARNLAKLTEEQVEYVFELADNKPEDLTARESGRWDAAVRMLAQAIVWAQEREEMENIPAFARKFFAGYQEGLVQIHVHKILGEIKERSHQGSFGFGQGYEDLTAPELVRYLDVEALDYVFDVIVDGVSYCVVYDKDEPLFYEDGERIEYTDEDVALVADALQEMLQQQLTRNFVAYANGDYRDVSLLAGIRRAEKPAEELENLKACKEVKDYLASLMK